MKDLNSETSYTFWTRHLTELIVAKWRHMASWNLVNIHSGNGLLHDGTKPLPESKFTLSYHQ